MQQREQVVSEMQRGMLIRVSTPAPRGLMKNFLWSMKFSSILMLHTYMLSVLGSKKSDADTKIIAGALFSVFTVFISIVLYLVAQRNEEEREYLKKLQAVLKKPYRLQLIQTALEKNLTFSPNEELQPDIWLSEEDLAEIRWGLTFIRRWTESSNQLAELIPTLFLAVTGQQIIPQPYQEAMGRLLLQAYVSPLQQIEEKLTMYEIDRTFGKGGLYYVSTNIHYQNIKLDELLKLVQKNIELVCLESLSLHMDAGYEQALIDLSDTPDPVTYATFKVAFLKTVKKMLEHDAIQTTLKLALGAAGWQLMYRIYLGSSNFFYDPSFLVFGWKKPLLWLSTGVGAAFALNAGIIASQFWLARYHGGVRLAHFQTLCAQLLFSVILADGLWQPFADLGTLYVGILHDIQPWLAYVAEPLVFFVAYLALSFFFKEMHNWTNRVHVENSGQKKFVCTNEFVGILTATYWSFKVIFGAVSFSAHLEKFTASHVLLDSLLAGLCSAFLPMLLMIGQNTRKMQSLTDGMEKVTIHFQEPESQHHGEVDQPLLTTSASDKEVSSFYDHPYTKFGLTTLGKMSSVYDKTIQKAASFFP